MDSQTRRLPSADRWWIGLLCGLLAVALGAPLSRAEGLLERITGMSAWDRLQMSRGYEREEALKALVRRGSSELCAPIRRVIRQEQTDLSITPALIRALGQLGCRKSLPYLVQLALRSGKPTYFYFKLKEQSYRNGQQPAVQVSITYLDRGNTAVAVEYDSSDKHVNASHPKGAGVFKEAHRFRVKQSGRWKTTVFDLKDANFSSRCNGGDLRLGFIRPDVTPVVAEVLVKPLR